MIYASHHQRPLSTGHLVLETTQSPSIWPEMYIRDSNVTISKPATAVVVGLTKAGKSTLLLGCGADVKTSSSPRSCTAAINAYEIGQHLVLVDTPGLEDAHPDGSVEKLTNQQIEEQVLEHLVSMKSSSINAVIWCNGTRTASTDVVSLDSSHTYRI
jgi:GTP-binding protein EngB required for normal cell division